MPEHLRALVVILVLAIAVFALAKAPVCALASSARDFERRRNLWFGVTLAAFFAHNFWIYIVVSAALLLYALPRERNKLAMFFLLLFAVPAISAKIPGFGVIEHFFAINYLRLLALAILLPAFLFLRKQPDVEPFGRTLPDKIIAGYLILNFALQLSVDSVTNSLRLGVLYSFLGVFLPYYVASRALRNLREFRDALMAFVLAALVLSAIGAFEFGKRWLLYSSLERALGESWGMTIYLQRGENLRVIGSTGQPIPFGFVMAVAMGFLLYLRASVPNVLAWNIGMLMLVVGLIVSLSRGPWVGAAAILMTFTATSPSAARGFVRLALLGVLALPLLLVTPLGVTITDYLPFVGSMEAENVSYRQRLLDVSIQVIMQNPWFGTFDFISAPAMQQLKQGQGIIDIVNTYLGVALGSGLVGLSIFSSFFIAVAMGVFNGIRNLADRHGELHLLGQALLATLLGIMVIIFTVSSITVIPVIYWAVAGLGVAYARMAALQRSSEITTRARSQQSPVQASG